VVLLQDQVDWAVRQVARWAREQRQAEAGNSEEHCNNTYWQHLLACQDHKNNTGHYPRRQVPGVVEAGDGSGKWLLVEAGCKQGHGARNIEHVVEAAGETGNIGQVVEQAAGGAGNRAVEGPVDQQEVVLGLDRGISPGFGRWPEQVSGLHPVPAFQSLVFGLCCLDYAQWFVNWARCG
jgi:hypothetical protein